MVTFSSTRPAPSRANGRGATNYRPDIDGLRAIAITSVVAYHVGLPGFSGGFVGVDVFFCISGFLIASIVLRDVDAGTFTFKGFYARRFRRILPALFVVIAATGLISLVILSPEELARLSVSGVTAVVGASNFHFRRELNYFAPAADTYPFLMTWSLAVEEQFYLLLPASLLLIRPLAIKWRAAVLGILTAISFALSVYLTPRMTAVAFYLLPCRGWELGFGVLLALWQRGKPIPRAPVWLSETSSLAGGTLIVASIAAFDDRTLVPGAAILLPVLGTALLIASPAAVINRHLLSSKPFVFVGLVSYSWYLWHWPILSLARTVTITELALPIVAMLGMLSFVLGIASWRFIETPFRQPRVGDAATIWRYVAVAAVLASSLVLADLTGGVQARFSPAVASAMVPDRAPGGCILARGESEPRLEARCVEAGHNAIALVGDSHANALAPGLRAWARNHGMAFVQFTKGGCPVLDGVTHFLGTKQPAVASDCALFQARVLAQLLERPGIQIVFMAGNWSVGLNEGDSWFYAPPTGGGEGVTPAQSAAFLEAGLSSIVRRLRLAGKKVVVFQDVPVLAFDPVRRFALRHMPTRRALAGLLESHFDDSRLRLDVSLAEVKPDLARPVVGAALANGAGYLLDPADVLCHEKRCSYGEGEQLYYQDADHLAVPGSLKVVFELDQWDTPR